jgi:serine protease Do
MKSISEPDVGVDDHRSWPNRAQGALTERDRVLAEGSVELLVEKHPSGSGAARRIDAFGSGFIIDPSGLIVTNRHVIEDAFDVAVILSDGTALPTRLLGTGRTIDIALLQVTPPKPLPAATWGDSDKVRVGDQVLAMGNPFGIGESVSAGIVSGKNRDILDTPFDDYIQADAAINKGSPVSRRP